MTQITGRDRIAAALESRCIDRVPFGAWGHLFDAEWEARTLADATVSTALAAGVDFVKLQLRSTCFAEAFGNVYRSRAASGDQPELVGGPVGAIRGVGAIARTSPSVLVLEEQVECLRLVREQLPPSLPLLQTVFSPASILAQLVGHDAAALRALFEQEPKGAVDALHAIAAALLTFTEQSLSAGSDGIYYALLPYAVPQVVGEDLYMRVAGASEQLVWSFIRDRGWFNIVHICGDGFAWQLVNALRPRAISWSIHGVGSPALAEVRERTGAAVVGGLHRYANLRDGRPDDVEAEARQCLATADTEGLILAPGCSVSPWPVAKPGNFQAAITAAEARGCGSA
jgi:uroporphyrinogen decarboxylase